MKAAFVKIFFFCLSMMVLDGLVEAQEIFEIEHGLYSTDTLKTNIQLDKQDKLIIQASDHLIGKIHLKTSSDRVIRVNFLKQARTDSRTKAFDYIDLISLSLETLPDYARLKLRAPNPPKWDIETEAGIMEVVIVVPAGFKIEIEALYFDVIAEGPFAELVNNKSLGRHDVSSVTDKLVIGTDNRRVNIQDIAGNIEVSTTNSSLTAQDIKNVTGQAVFRNDGGDIKIDGIRGDVNIRSSYGRISIMDFTPKGESNYIRGTSGPISIELLEMASGQLVVSNRYEDIEIMIPDTLTAFFSLAVEEGGLIEALNFPFRTELVERDRLNLISGEGENEVEVRGSIRGTGNIYIRGIKGD